jgi:hypothetical protein
MCILRCLTGSTPAYIFTRTDPLGSHSIFPRLPLESWAFRVEPLRVEPPPGALLEVAPPGLSSGALVSGVYG